MPQPDIGDRVFIRPTSSNVLADGYTGRFLPLEGEDVVWTAHHAVRFRHGEIEVQHRAIAPRELAPGEMLEAAPMPAGALEAAAGVLGDNAAELVPSPAPSQSVEVK
jgi:hypothetical protein